MATITVMREEQTKGTALYRAASGKLQASGNTIGQAIDSLSEQLGEHDSGTLLIIQNLKPDRFFNDTQRQRLVELMSEWRSARDGDFDFPAEKQIELEILANEELVASGERAKSLLSKVA